jgi:hypothetical protein
LSRNVVIDTGSASLTPPIRCWSPYGSTITSPALAQCRGSVAHRDPALARGDHVEEDHPVGAGMQHRRRRRPGQRVVGPGLAVLGPEEECALQTQPGDGPGEGLGAVGNGRGRAVRCAGRAVMVRRPGLHETRWCHNPSPVSGREKEPAMPLFMDVHTMDGAIAVDDVAQAHQADLRVQGTRDVSYLQYWVDEPQGKIFCLVDAPSAEAGRRGPPRGPRSRRGRDLPGGRGRVVGSSAGVVAGATTPALDRVRRRRSRPVPPRAPWRRPRVRRTPGAP